MNRLVVAHPTGRADLGLESETASIERSWGVGFKKFGLSFAELHDRHATPDGRAERASILEGARLLLVTASEIDQAPGLHLPLSPYQASHVVAAAEAHVPVAVASSYEDVSGLTVMVDAIETAWSGAGCRFVEPGSQMGWLRTLVDA